MKIGRNERCPCGSGQKYKRCCLINDSLTTILKDRDCTPLNVEDSDILAAAAKFLSEEQRRQFFMCQHTFYWGANRAALNYVYEMQYGRPSKHRSSSVAFGKDLSCLREIFRGPPSALSLFVWAQSPAIASAAGNADVRQFLAAARAALSPAALRVLENPASQQRFIQCTQTVPLTKSMFHDLQQNPSWAVPQFRLNVDVIQQDIDDSIREARVHPGGGSFVIWKGVLAPGESAIPICLLFHDGLAPHMLGNELLTLVSSFGPPEYQSYRSAVPLTTSVFFFKGTGDFVDALAQRFQKSLLETTITLLQCPLFFPLSPCLLPNFSEFGDTLSQYAARKSSNGSSEAVTGAIQLAKSEAAGLLLKMSELADPQFAELLRLMKDDGDGRLRALFKAVWGPLERSYIGKLRNFVVTTKQMENLLFKSGASPKVGTDSARVVMGSIRNLRRTGQTAAIADDLRCRLALRAAQDYSQHLAHERGYSLPGLLEIVLDQTPSVRFDKPCLAAGYEAKLRLSQTFVLDSFQGVQEAVRWAHFEMLAHYSEASGLGRDDARQLAAQRTGLVLRARFRASLGEIEESCFSADADESDLSDADRRTLDRVNKLFNLASSSNEAEAELAMERAHDMLRKSRLDHYALGGGRDVASVASSGSFADMTRMTIFTGPKSVQRLADEILALVQRHYGVVAIWGSCFHPDTGAQERSADILGPRVSVLMAEHVIDLLCRQADVRWQEAKAVRDFGARQRLSYQIGIVRGFSKKLSVQKAAQGSSGTAVAADPEEGRLIALERNGLDEWKRYLYPQLSGVSRSKYTIDAEAYHSGQEVGGDIVIHTPLDSGATRSPMGGLGGLIGPASVTDCV